LAGGNVGEGSAPSLSAASNREKPGAVRRAGDGWAAAEDVIMRKAKKKRGEISAAGSMKRKHEGKRTALQSLRIINGA